jgi:hypothetical protein
MEKIIELENIVSDDGMSAVHLVSNFDLTVDVLKKYNAPVDAKVEIKKEAGAYHLRATWAMRGALKIAAEGWPVPKIFVMWNLTGCKSVSMAIREAAAHYKNIYGVLPEYAFIRKLPGIVESGVEVDNLMLFEAEWMVRKCVAVGWLYQ